MGGGASKKQIHEEVVNEVKMSPILHKLHLDDHTFEEMMKTFHKVDRHKDNQITYEEYMTFYGLEKSFFSKMVFSRMDYGKSGTLDFEEYAVSVWDFLTSDLNRFVFQTYDSNESGDISGKEFGHITRSAYNMKFGENAALDKIISSQDKNGDGALTFEEFEHIINQNRTIQFSGYAIQKELMDRNGGSSLWHKLKSERQKRFGEKTIHEIVKS